ncbi:MAG: hypothetical protein DRJ03_09315 [Chloroflexi bacterium]|nr:MAG: hypothetical protein DRJ03_09315 [Chloroflexota bacterium]
MLVNQTLKILRKLLEKCDVTEVLITEAEEPFHIETSEPEFDIIIVQNLSHGQIQAIDEVLADFPNVEMELKYEEGLKIFEVES